MRRRDDRPAPGSEQFNVVDEATEQAAGLRVGGGFRVEAVEEKWPTLLARLDVQGEREIQDGFSEAEEHHEEHDDAQQRQTARDDGGGRVRNLETESPHCLQARAVLNRSEQERKVAEESEPERDGTRADHMFTGFQASRKRYDFEELVHTEAESDQCRGRPDPRHHGAFVSEASALESQFVTNWKLRLRD